MIDISLKDLKDKSPSKQSFKGYILDQYRCRSPSVRPAGLWRSLTMFTLHLLLWVGTVVDVFMIVRHKKIPLRVSTKGDCIRFAKIKFALSLL